MIKNYALKLFTPLIFSMFLHFQITAQVRIVEVDPATETVKLHNFGANTVDVSSYRFCTLFNYQTLSNLTVQSGSLSLAANADVVIMAGADYLNDTAADLGLYLGSGSFASSTAMQDFTQWGSGGNGREGVAVTKGIWTAGTFINVASPYEYTGDGAQNGSQFWDTLLGVEEFSSSQFKILQNPSSSRLTISLPRVSSVVTLDVFDVLGKNILSKEVSGVNPSIDVSKWNSGVYLVRISSENVTQTKRFVKQ